MRRRNVGFTMIELMAVIAIIGMLAAILFPVFAKAKGAAERTSCLSNLKELTLAGIIYAQDHDDRLFPFGYDDGPIYRTWWGDLKSGEAKDGLLFPYTKSGRIRGCPTARDLPNELPYGYPMGYGMNFRMFYEYDPEPGYGYRTISMTEVERTAETVYGGDSARWDDIRREALGSAWLLGDGWSSHFQSRHAGRVANIAWLDGHTKGVQLYYHQVPQGRGEFMVEPEDLSANNLGDYLKFPIENPTAPANGVRDQFYFLLQKPAGT